MTQLSAMPTVTKLALHRETVLHLGGRQIGEDEPCAPTFGGCTFTCGGCPTFACTITCAKHCTKKPGGCVA